MSSEGRLRVAAVGDLLLTSGSTGMTRERAEGLVSPEIAELWADCDLVMGNLECTMPGNGQHVPTEPRVVANGERIRAIREAGVHAVSLANNHMFDCLEAGFLNLRAWLDEMGLVYFGAGMDLEEAAAPAVWEAGGLRVALLGAADERSGPFRFAGPSQWGVAPLDVERLTDQIRALRAEVDHVIVSVHWGEERFWIPSPRQIEQAHALVEAGASMVLGHHPHVLQGLAFWHGAPISYSLGNFLADEVFFSDGDVLRWNRAERTGAILRGTLARDGVGEVSLVPTHDDGCVIALDRSGAGSRRLAKAHRMLERQVTLARYRRHHVWVKTIKPALGKLRWSRLKKLRLGSFRRALEQLRRARTAE